MTEPALVLRGIRKRYPPRDGAAAVDLLCGVDLSVAPGEFISIEGPSGSGKSTLLHIAGGLDREFDGQARVFGKDLPSMRDDELAALRHDRIGFVFQAFNLLAGLSALENVLLPDAFGRGVPDAEARAKAALQRVGLYDKASARPGSLSGGERQRVAIARALVVKPGLLLADEPTGNLDTRTGDEIIRLFTELNREGLTLLVVTHEARVSAAASRVLLLNDGVLVPPDADHPASIARRDEARP
jgi:putative ABC transport system ATP-binding protein